MTGTLHKPLRYSDNTMRVHVSNPKTEPTDNTRKDPDEWLSGDDPMTGAQASYLKTAMRASGDARNVRRKPHEGRGVETDRRYAEEGTSRLEGWEG